jgi:tRNA G18 (ribose-2'-O)-methylase SpoU
VVRTANAFLAREVLIVGRRRWNRRGAMVTDRYQHIAHLASAADLADYASEHGYDVVGIDNLPGSVPLETTRLPANALLVFGQESTGLSAEAREVCAMTLSIASFGSTRSINAGVAAGIAMHAWVRQHVLGQEF